MLKFSFQGHNYLEESNANENVYSPPENDYENTNNTIYTTKPKT